MTRYCSISAPGLTARCAGCRPGPTRCWCVATEEPTSLTDAYAVMKLYAADRPQGDVRVVVNQAATRQAGERTFATLERACQTFLGRAPPSPASSAATTGCAMRSAARR